MSFQEFHDHPELCAHVRNLKWFQPHLLGSSRPNVVYTVFLGNTVKAGTFSGEPCNHFNLLRTVESNFGLSPSLLDNNVAAIDGVWR